MKILGVGLSKTGTTSLNQALNILGFKSIHYEPERLADIISGNTSEPDFDRYNDVDAVTDLPAAYFYEELLAIYPECKCILTLRDEDSWWASIQKHFNERDHILSESDDPLNWNIRTYVYGSVIAKEYLFRKKYRQHNQRVLSVIPKDRLLLMNIIKGDGWAKLCPFLDCDKPTIKFPHKNANPEPKIINALSTIHSIFKKGDTFVLLDHEILKRNLLSEYIVKNFSEKKGVDFGLPVDSNKAIEEVDFMLKSGVTHIVIAWTAFWFFDYYKKWYQYMLQEFKLVHESDHLMIFKLSL